MALKYRHKSPLVENYISFFVLRALGFNLLSYLRVAFHPLMIHAFQQRDVNIDEIINDNFVFAFVSPVKPSGILSDGATPCDRRCQQQRVWAWTIKTFVRILSRRNYNERLVSGNIIKLLKTFKNVF